MLRIADQGTISHDAGRGAYMPWITPLADGSFVASQHVGSGLGSPDNHVVVLRSEDGRRFTEVGVASPAGDGYAYRGPQISVAGEGPRLVMTCSRFETGGGGQIFDPDTEELQRPELCLLWSEDGGATWGELTEVANDPAGGILYWDQMNCRLADGRIYSLIWTHLYGTSDDIENHWVISEDEGRTWSEPRPTNLRGQVCTPVPLADGRVAAVYNYRHEPQGVRAALTEDLSTFDTDNEVVLFDAGAEATLGTTAHENFLAEHMLIAFGKPGGRRLDDGSLLAWFWCTSGGVTHTRWVRLEAD